MNRKDILNYVISAALIAVTGLPFLCVDGIGVWLWLGVAALYIVYWALTIWNRVGDMIIAKWILRAYFVEEKDAITLPIIREFYCSRTGDTDCDVFCSRSIKAYLIILGADKAVVSLGAVFAIYREGVEMLNQRIGTEVFEKHSRFSRKTVLLMLIALPLVRWIIDKSAMIIIRTMEFIFGLVTAKVRSSWFDGSWDDICESYIWGRGLNSFLRNVYNTTASVQDKIVNWFVNITQQAEVNYLEMLCL